MMNMFRPFRAELCGISKTQSVALGYYVSPLWGEKQTPKNRYFGFLDRILLFRLNFHPLGEDLSSRKILYFLNIIVL